MRIVSKNSFEAVLQFLTMSVCVAAVFGFANIGIFIRGDGLKALRPLAAGRPALPTLRLAPCLTCCCGVCYYGYVFDHTKPCLLISKIIREFQGLEIL